ncbi:MAG: hypothetical protein AAF823_14615 [Planctomycetota bacterium]
MLPPDLDRPDDPDHPVADGFHPPSVPTLVGCLHCRQIYESFLIEWRVKPNRDGVPRGFWCCPIPGCDGAGFGMDIWPIDPEYDDPDDRGIRITLDDDEEDDEDAWDEVADIDDDHPGTPQDSEQPGNLDDTDDDPIPF